MIRYVLAPAARDDLRSIFDYLESQSIPTAIRYDKLIHAAFLRIAQSPQLGHRRADLQDPSIRCWVVPPYLIFYLEQTAPLQIVAILHGARDIPSVFQGPDRP